MSDRPPRKPSGEHPAVEAFRAKLESLAETPLEALREFNRKLDEELASLPPPPPKPLALAEDDGSDEETKPCVDHSPTDLEETKP